MLAAAVTVTVAAAVIVDGDFAGTSREHLFNANEIKTHSDKHKRLTKRFLFYSLLRRRTTTGLLCSRTTTIADVTTVAVGYYYGCC